MLSWGWLSLKETAIRKVVERCNYVAHVCVGFLFRKAFSQILLEKQHRQRRINGFGNICGLAFLFPINGFEGINF